MDIKIIEINNRVKGRARDIKKEEMITSLILLIVVLRFHQLIFFCDLSRNSSLDIFSRLTSHDGMCSNCHIPKGVPKGV